MAVNGILLGQTGNFADKTLSNIEPASTTETTAPFKDVLSNAGFATSDYLDTL